MQINKIYKEIDAYLLDDISKAEHKRIWKSLAPTWKEQYLSTYLLYLDTFAKLRRDSAVDTSVMDVKQKYMFNNTCATHFNQHTIACKLLKLTPSTEKPEAGIRTGRKPKDTSISLRDSLIA